MGPYTKAVLFVIRMVASVFILVSVVYLGLDLLLMRQGIEVQGGWRLAVKALPLVIGLLIWIKSHPMARRLTRDFEDE